MGLADHTVGDRAPTVEYKVVRCYDHRLQEELDEAVRHGWALQALTSPGNQSALIVVLSRPVAPPPDKVSAAQRLALRLGGGTIAPAEHVTLVTNSSPKWVPTHRSVKDGSEVRHLRTTAFGRVLVENENGDLFVALTDEWEVIQ